MSQDRIDPRVLKGFRDTLPAQEGERQRIMGVLSGTFGQFGFVPIDTPVLEYTEILLGKGGGETDKQIYRFEDNGGRDVAMRFDLTVPFARFMAMHLHELYLPFKRFHMAKAFRGENTQRGRFREFIQCDFDVVGTDSVSADFEVVLLVRTAFAAMGVNDVTVHLSDRGLFNAMLREAGVDESSAEVLRTVDKFHKVGEQEVSTELEALVGEETAARIVGFISANGSNTEILDTLAALAPSASRQISRLRELLAIAAANGIEDGLVLDPSITRGLDYYTGIVFETFMNRLPQIGSVCSGGRYDNLASLYSKEVMPGVGGSIGLDRLMAALDELDAAGSEHPAADTLILCQNEKSFSEYHRVATALRAGGVRVDVFPENKKLGQQFAVAEKKGIPTALFVDDEDLETGHVKVRTLASRNNSGPLLLDSAAKLILSLRAGG